MDSITQIFTQKTVEETQDLERKTRHEIELKKEELRQMVGERYRDLIEAADTISEMKVCSTSVRNSVKDLQQFYADKSLYKGRSISLVKKKKSTSINRYMEVAAQAKVVMEMPEKIWSHVEAGLMINASFLYLQSLQVLKNLSLDGTTTYSPLLLWFPMLTQQAQAVGNLRPAILRECHLKIQDHLLHTDKLAEALCSIVILEKMSVNRVLKVLLDARFAALKETLNDGFVGFERKKNVGAKAQICDSSTIVRQTVLQVHDLFCAGNGGLLAKLLEKCMTMQSHNVSGSLFCERDDASKAWMKHLPSDTRTCFVSPKTEEFIISSDILQSSCLKWFADCEVQLRSGIKNLLKFTSSAKDLAIIRTSLLETLYENEDKDTGESENDVWVMSENDSSSKMKGVWVKCSKAVLSREVDIWKEIHQNLFVEKISFLVKETFHELLCKSKDVFSLSSALPPKIEDMCSYIWEEHDGDISQNMAWNTWQARKQNDLTSQGGLSLKAATVTPSIQHAYKDINAILSELLLDLQNYTSTIAIAAGNSEKHSTPMSTQQAEEDPENKAVIDHLKKYCYDFFSALLSYVHELEEDINKAAPECNNSRGSLDYILHLSLLCRNFFDLCHSFKKCCCSRESPVSHAVLKRTLSSSYAGRSRLESSKDEDTTAWTEVVEKMSLQGRNFMSIWCKAVLNESFNTYKQELLASSFNGNILNSLALWDTITIQEESETGETVSSLIKVPSSTTSFTQQFLYKICSELNRVGGYSACRHTLHELAQQSLTAVYVAFSEARRTLSSGDANLHGQSRIGNNSNTPSQTWALQCLFDLRYVHSLLYQPSSASLDDNDQDFEECDNDAPLYTFTELVDWLEGYVDPFDLDVFSPHITRNIQRHVSRTCVLLGLLTSPEKINSSMTQKFASTAKDSHNVLPLSPDCGRFSYLPVSSRSIDDRSMSKINSTLSRQLPLANALRDLTSTSVDEDEKSLQHNKITSSIYSKLGALSSSWLSMSSSYSED